MPAEPTKAEAEASRAASSRGDDPQAAGLGAGQLPQPKLGLGGWGGVGG